MAKVCAKGHKRPDRDGESCQERVRKPGYRCDVYRHMVERPQDMGGFLVCPRDGSTVTYDEGYCGASWQSI